MDPVEDGYRLADELKQGKPLVCAGCGEPLGTDTWYDVSTNEAGRLEIRHSGCAVEVAR